MLIGCFGESRSIDVASDESSGKQSLIDGLRAHIDRIEGGAELLGVGIDAAVDAEDRAHRGRAAVPGVASAHRLLEA